MPAFSYTAKNSYGKSVAGTVDARTPEVAVSLLKNQNLTVISIQEKKERAVDILSNLKGVPFGEVVTFTRQLSTMISAGLPISRALEVLSNQSVNKNFKKIITEVLRSVEGGVSLSMALGVHSRVFSNTYVSLVRAGESSGKLDIILKKLADNMEADRDLNSKFKSAMIYPAVILVAMVAVFIILMIFVMPQMSEMYKNMNIELPATTKLMIALSDFMVKYVYIVVLAIVGIVIGVRSFTTSEKGKIIMSDIAIKIPVFGKITLQKDFASFSRTLSLLINSGVPIVEALNTVSMIMSSQTLKDYVSNAARQVEKGNSLSSYFKSTTQFPPLLGQMAGVGEETGKMDEVLERVAVYYEGEVNNLVKGLTTALEPIILVMLGVMVGFMIISIITPIYKITSAI